MRITPKGSQQPIPDDPGAAAKQTDGLMDQVLSLITSYDQRVQSSVIFGISHLLEAAMRVLDSEEQARIRNNAAVLANNYGLTLKNEGDGKGMDLCLTCFCHPSQHAPGCAEG